MAYEEVVNFAFKTGWDSALIRTDPAHLTFAQFADARSYMTPSCRRAFDAVLVKAMQADRAAITTLEEMVFFGVTGSKGMTPVAQGHVVTDRKFTAASVVLERTHRPARLAVSFAAKANIQLRNAAGTRYTMATGRVMTYLLMPNTGSDRARRPFLIDSWRSKASVTRPALPH